MQMSYGDVANLLIRFTKEFRNSAEGQALILQLADRPITGELATQLLTPFITVCETEVKRLASIQRADNAEIVIEALKRDLVEWAPAALAGIHRNHHMNQARGGGTLNQDTADALIVDYANKAAQPLDLALSTDDLYP